LDSLESFIRNKYDYETGELHTISSRVSHSRRLLTACR
jgi:hypothetical protein